MGADHPRGNGSGGPHVANDADARTRYAGYDVLAKWRSPDWDEPTRAVVRRRLHEVPPVRFLTTGEAATLAAVAERIVPQSSETDRVAIVPWIDEKLHEDQRDGYRYEEMPPLREAWRLGIAGIDESARLLHGHAFADLDAAAQDDVLSRVQRAEAPGEAWRRVCPRRFFRDVLCLTVVKTYYAHPAAWSAIGYSGPAAVRGHVRNWPGGVDPWDAREEDDR